MKDKENFLERCVAWTTPKFNWGVKNTALGVLTFLEWIGWKDLVSAGTNLAVVYFLGVIFLGALLVHIVKK